MPASTSRATVSVGVPASRIAQMLGRLFLRFFGWRVTGTLPDVRAAVVIAAPHTTNWDMPFMLAVSYVLGVKPSWLGKRELFRFPFGGFMRWLGGVPVDRSVRQDTVRQAIDRFDAGDPLFLVIPPSGTRAKATHWKSGFYHVARGARAPIVCAFLDYSRKVGGVGLTFTPTGDVVADMDRIRAFYAPIHGRFPAQATPIRLREEGDDTAAEVG